MLELAVLLCFRWRRGIPELLLLLLLLPLMLLLAWRHRRRRRPTLPLTSAWVLVLVPPRVLVGTRTRVKRVLLTFLPLVAIVVHAQHWRNAATACHAPGGGGAIAISYL